MSGVRLDVRILRTPYQVLPGALHASDPPLADVPAARKKQFAVEHCVAVRATVEHLGHSIMGIQTGWEGPEDNIAEWWSVISFDAEKVISA